MVALQIRGVTSELRETLVAESRRRGQSLQAYLLDVVEAEGRRVDNADLLSEVASLGGGLEGFGGAEAVRSARDEREGHIEPRRAPAS